MTAIKIDQFFGEAPRFAPYKLNSSQAQKALNCNLLHRDLRPLLNVGSPVPLAKTGTIQTIYWFAGQYWFHWIEQVDVVRGPVAGDTTERTYFTGTAAGPQVTNSPMAVTGGNLYPMASWDLGVPAPTAAPSVSAAKNKDASLNDTRSYVYTYVTAWGEEGPPSPPSQAVDVDIDVFGKPLWVANHAYKVGQRVRPRTANGFVYECTAAGTSGATEPAWPTVSGNTVASGTATFKAVPRFVSLTGLSAAPVGNYNITKKRIYRTNSSGIETDFQFVAEIPAGTTSYNDSKRSSALGEVLATTDFDPPPPDLLGLTAMPNGILAGFSGNQVCFSEPYQPHAWPVKYRYALKLPPGGSIVGLGSFGNSLLVLTTGEPYVLTGTHPSMMSMEKLEISQPCVSKRGIVDMGHAIAYPSPDGLVVIGISGSRVITEELFARSDWQALNPSSIHAYLWDGRYVGFYDATGVGGSRGAFILDPKNPDVSVTFTDFYADAGFTDVQTDSLYLVQGGASNSVVRWNAGAPMAYTWRSKKFRLPHATNFSCAQVLADAYPVTIRIYADGVLRHTQNVMGHNVFRLPAGFLSDEWEVEITGSSTVRAVYLAESVAELRAM